MKPIYQCDWCGKRDTEEEIRCHEPLCVECHSRLHPEYDCEEW